ncbi:helix-turn-helix domain-containing protein [Deinococcus ruber]|uniref:HTH cro/C1-type domain-containing protein n=1 Tax=Deinococcus ruber TaxID=1848197 RepID=A0A918C8U9_9DEIO|nr:helix-turn-helix transcriptional regulator [Deinococcus ruber]GGR11623.1 hypothetical protein GCM10008957_25770 [Deinococcus ruber]
MTTLKKLREAAGFDRQKFAQITGFSVYRIEKHEQGVHRISLDDAAHYARHLSRPLRRSTSRLLAELAGLEKEAAPPASLSDIQPQASA